MLTLLASVALVSQPLPPAPAIFDPFILWFEYASVELTPRQNDLVANIQKAFEAAKAKRIEIVGHADCKGSSSFNLQLSLRRAEAVKAALVSRGVPGKAIVVDGVGEDWPLIQTEDGVPERQNRYVSVLIY